MEQNIYGPGNDNYGRDKNKIGLSETEKRQIMAHEKERELLIAFKKYVLETSDEILSDLETPDRVIDAFLSTLPEEKEEEKKPTNKTCAQCKYGELKYDQMPCEICANFSEFTSIK